MVILTLWEAFGDLANNNVYIQVIHIEATAHGGQVSGELLRAEWLNRSVSLGDGLLVLSFFIETSTVVRVQV